MSYRKTPVITEDELKEYMRDHTNAESAKYFGVSIRTIARKLQKFGFCHEELKYGCSFTDLQKEILVGCLLGDGGLQRKRFQFGQKSSRKEYVKWLNDQLKPFSLDIYSDKSVGDDGKEYFSWRFVTGNHSLFKELRDKWYVKGIKTIPRNIVLSPVVFAHWMVQDGSNHQRKRSYRISTNGLSEGDVKFLIRILERDLSVKATLNKQRSLPTIHIGAYEYFNVIDILKPHVTWSCFNYKIDTSKVPPKNNENMGTKLSMKKAKNIRSLYNRGSDINYLADLFDVTTVSIRRVIQNITYKEKQFAKVSVQYNP